MYSLRAHWREAGHGPGVVCLHANASSSSQWRDLMERLAPGHHVLAPDTYGAGHAPQWPPGRPAALRDEVALLQPVLALAGAPFALVGHSYGGAVTLVAALQQPQRVCALALYEPTLFALVDAARPSPNDADGIRDVHTRVVAALAAGRRDAAARHFIDYWMGEGRWFSMPATRRAAIEATIVNAQHWFEALFGEPTPLAAFGELKMPVLLMTGRDSAASALAVARLLARTLPNVEVQSFAGLGHMGPVTHPDAVNAAIEDFLRRNPAS